MEELVNRVARTAAEERLWQAGDTVVVAVSGGPDSSALLHMLHRLSKQEGLTLVAAHVNHGFRRVESAREAAAVKQFCSDLGIACEYAEIDLPAYIEQTKLNAQLAAREKRYAFLREVAESCGAVSIALAHHADDQAETVFMRLMRGTGTGGLAGMAIQRREKNVELIRPLLRITKTELLSYCHTEGVPFSEDSSNLKRDYFRNVIRLDILPYLKQFNPQFSQSLVRLAEISAAEDDLLERETGDIFRASVRTVPGGLSMNRIVLSDLHVALQRRLIKLILNYVGSELGTVSYDRIEEIRSAAADDETRNSRKADIGGRIRFIREGDKLSWLHIVQRIDENNGSYAYTVEQGTESLFIREIGATLIFSIHPPEEAARAAGRNEALFDVGAVSFPLTVRTRKAGDRMAVQGLNGTKKVQDMFIDDKISPAQRGVIPLVWDAEGRLLWIPGVRRSAHAQPDEASTLVVRIVYTESGGTDD
jgi:tRNA(Ile)-lysidine synthase